MPDEESTAPAAAESPEEEVDDTVPCPACHQPVRLGLLAEKYVADLPVKVRSRAARTTRGED